MTTASNTNEITADGKIGTNSFFNNINLPPITVSQNVNDAVVAYFEMIADNKDSARALAAAVILTSVSQGIDPMQTLDEFTKLERGRLNDYLTMFLNLSRIGTSFLGVNNRPTTSKYVARNILP